MAVTCGSSPPGAQVAATFSTLVESWPSAPVILSAPPSDETVPSSVVPVASRTTTGASVVIPVTSDCLIVRSPAKLVVTKTLPPSILVILPTMRAPFLVSTMSAETADAKTARPERINAVRRVLVRFMADEKGAKKPHQRRCCQSN